MRPIMPNDLDASYNGERIRSPLSRRPSGEKLALMDWHPLFTGRYPSCESTIAQTEPPRVIGTVNTVGG